MVDRAWGVSHHKQKKEKGAENSGGIDRNDLELKPVGQDSKRERYWVADGPCSFIFGFQNPVFPFFHCYRVKDSLNFAWDSSTSSFAFSGSAFDLENLV